MSLDIPPEGKDPALWGGITAAFMMRIPLLQRPAYFVAGVASSKFLAPWLARFVGDSSGDATAFLVGFFGALLLEKVVDGIRETSLAQAVKDVVGAVVKRIGG